MEKLSSEQSETSDRVLEFDLSAELRHGIAVSNLAYALSKELGLPHEQCYDLAIAGMLHDIGKLKLRSYINGQESNPMVIEEGYPCKMACNKPGFSDSGRAYPRNRYRYQDRDPEAGSEACR